MPIDDRAPWDPEDAVPSGSPPNSDGFLADSEGDALPWALPVDGAAFLPMALPADDIPSVVAFPKPPQPTHWLATLLCIVYLVVTQVIPAMAIIGVMFLIQIISAGDVQAGINEMIGTDKGQGFSRRILMPTLLASQIVGILFSLLMIRLFMGRDWSRKIALRKPGLVHLALVLIGFPSLPILASGIFEMAKHFLPSFGDLFRHLMPSFINWPAMIGIHLDQDIMGMEDLVKEVRTWPWQLAVLVIGLGPGLNEELWCRGFLGRGLVARYGYIPGIIMTSILFGALHIDPQQGLMAACMGLALHYTYITTRSLWIPMLLHFMNNSLSAIAGHLGSEAEKIDTAGDAIPVALYLASAVLMAAVGYALYVSRARLAPANKNVHYTWRPDYPGVEFSPKGTGTIVYRPWPGFLASGLVLIGLAIFLTTAFWTYYQQM
jgi:uncharacterized protein